MNIQFTKEEKEVVGAVKYLPAVSMILPFEPVMAQKSELEHRLKLMQGKVESELMATYPAEKAMPVIVKLKRIVQDLNFHTRKKALAIFVSPIVEKVFYLDIPVNEKIVIDESFEIRDLIYSKKEVIQYLVLQLSAEESRVYLGDCSSFVLIKSNVPENMHAYERDMPEKTGNFSDAGEHKEILLDQFLHHLDQGLTHILSAYPLPVFVMGPEKVLGHFKKITKNAKSLVESVHGNYLHASEPEIREALAPYLAEWHAVKELALLMQLENARGENKLECGIRQVWQAAAHKNGRLLLVENNFMVAARQGARADEISDEDFATKNAFYIKDAVDDVMEKVLAAGGDIEFVSDGALANYEHIALIRFY